MTMLRAADEVRTAPVTAFGLLGGFLAARETGVRALGGVVLAAAGLYAGRTWLAKRGPGVAGLLAALYLGAFGGSHPLAKRIGAWPAVFAVTGVAAGAAYLLADRDD